jgi:hypothetical protein
MIHLERMADILISNGQFPSEVALCPSWPHQNILQFTGSFLTSAVSHYSLAAVQGSDISTALVAFRPLLHHFRLVFGCIVRP